MATSAGYRPTRNIPYPGADSFLQDNVLLDDELRVKIADFGLTRASEANNTRSGTFNHNFAAPELLRLLSGYIPAQTHISDVYAFGCLYYEVCHNNCTRALLLNCLLDPLWQ